MDGIHVLNVISHNINTWGINGIVIFCGSIALIGIVLGITLGHFIDDSWSVLAVFAMIPLFIGVMVASEATLVKTYNTYEVTIDETVNFTEFMQAYDLIEQRGEIYVIKEKGTP